MEYSNNKILVVDDNKSIHNDFKRILGSEDVAESIDTNINLFEGFMEEEIESSSINSDLNFNVDFAIQGQDAYEMIKESLAEGNPYALVFMDVRMPPGWDGLKTLEEIFKIDKNIQAVICSAYSDYSFIDLKERFGESDSILFLKKPFDSHEVLQLTASLTKK